MKEDWISVKEASDILTKNSGHAISTAYVHRLITYKKLATKRIDERTYLIRREDCEKYTVKKQIRQKDKE